MSQTEFTHNNHTTNCAIDLTTLGFHPFFQALAAEYPAYYPARVLSQSKDLYTVCTASGTLMAKVSGKFRFAVQTLSDFPAVGDFVLLDRDNDAAGYAVIHHVLPRRSVFLRKAAGTAQEEQIVASNIDTVFLCMSLNQDFNLRRLERYLSIGWDSGATPVIVLTKADLCDDVPQRLREVEAIAIGADILVTSALTNDGCPQIQTYLQPGRTVAFIGSSGVGKSTLINTLLGQTQLATGGLRKDDKGRHTTTRRQLFVLPQGGMVIDTPGMRELGIERADFTKSFADIEALAVQCKFRDCTHSGEPGCAVQQAIANGTLDVQRLANYQKLQKEVSYEGLQSRQIEEKKLERMFSEIGGMKNARKLLKEKSKRR